MLVALYFLSRHVFSRLEILLSSTKSVWSIRDVIKYDKGMSLILSSLYVTPLVPACC